VNDQDPFPLHASTQWPICYTAPDHTWLTWHPGSPNDGTVSVNEDGVVMIQPTVPDGGDQLVVYRGPGTGGWHVRIVRFCANQPGCTTNIGAWIGEQLITTARSLLPSALYAFFGGFLLALGVVDVWRHRSSRVG
jgi:hypothetical protein